MTLRFVKPAEGRRVRVPSLKFRLLPAEGLALPDDAWLRRRLADIDVVDAEPEDLGAPEADLVPADEPTI